MANRDKGLQVGKFGGLFFGKESDNPVQGGKVANFTLAGEPPTGWESACYLSLENLPQPTINGGDSAALGTWQQRNTGTNVNDVSYSIAYTGVQVDAQTLDALNAMREAGVPISVFHLTQGPDGRRTGEWWPTSTFAMTGAPTKSTSGYTTIQFTITQGAPASTINLKTIKAGVTPATACGQYFDGLMFDDEAFKAGA